MKRYIRLARPQHWIKNILVLLPLFFSGLLGRQDLLLQGGSAFLSFSLLASAIYCINDIRDRDRDRMNPAKCGRPIAAGEIRVSHAVGFCLVLLAGAAACALAAGSSSSAWLCLGGYFLLNLGYSMGLKSVPLLDIAILALGFLLRLLYGSYVTGIQISKWLCLTVIAVSFYLGLGKRRGEYDRGGTQSRAVLEFYSERFLNQNMYMCVTLAVVFYALWAVDAMTVARAGGEALVWTVPLVIVICMRYSLDIEGDSSGDPVEVLLHDRVLLVMGLCLAAAIFWMIYF